MRPSLALLLLPFISACAFQAQPLDDSSESPESPTETARFPEPFPKSHLGSDPCVVGTKEVFQGHTFTIPVFCADEYIDRGDPAPDDSIESIGSVKVNPGP